MPNPARSPRLWLRRSSGRQPTWVILDRGRQIGTGRGAGDRAGAEQALADYIRAKYTPRARGGRLDEILIADVMMIYLREHAPTVARPDFLATSSAPIISWWGTRPLSAIRGQTCRDYVAWRTAQRVGSTERRVSAATARHDLTILRAAIGHYHREHGPLDAVPAVTLPANPDGKDRWLTRAEAARLLWACRNGHATGPGWPRLARFVALALYTGTRRDAILRLSWVPSLTSGYIDLEAGVIVRAGKLERATKKRRPVCRIPDVLRPMLARWRAADMASGWHHVCHEHGRLAPSIRTAWARAAAAAGLGTDVTPHTLRHTACTWMMRDGVPIAEAAGFVGMSVTTFERVYGHHHPDHQEKAAARRKAR